MVTPKIEDIENAYVDRLEKGNKTDDPHLTDEEQIKHSSRYGKMTKDKVEGCIKEIKRYCSSSR